MGASWGERGAQQAGSLSSPAARVVCRIHARVAPARVRVGQVCQPALKASSQHAHVCVGVPAAHEPHRAARWASISGASPNASHGLNGTRYPVFPLDFQVFKLPTLPLSVSFSWLDHPNRQMGLGTPAWLERAARDLSNRAGSKVIGPLLQFFPLKLPRTQPARPKIETRRGPCH